MFSKSRFSCEKHVFKFLNLHDVFPKARISLTWKPGKSPLSRKILQNCFWGRVSSCLDEFLWSYSRAFAGDSGKKPGAYRTKLLSNDLAIISPGVGYDTVRKVLQANYWGFRVGVLVSPRIGQRCSYSARRPNEFSDLKTMSVATGNLTCWRGGTMIFVDDLRNRFSGSAAISWAHLTWLNRTNHAHQARLVPGSQLQVFLLRFESETVSLANWSWVLAPKPPRK